MIKKKMMRITLMIKNSSMGHNLRIKMKATLLNMMKVVLIKNHRRFINNSKKKKYKRLTKNHNNNKYQSKQMLHPPKTQGQGEVLEDRALIYLR